MFTSKTRLILLITAITLMTLFNGMNLYRTIFPASAAPTITDAANDPMEVAYERDATSRSSAQFLNAR